MSDRCREPKSDVNRRDFLKSSLTAAAAVSATTGPARARAEAFHTVDDFDRPDGYYHGDGWESLNPGYWMIRGGALRRRLKHRGDQRPGHMFPWHWETHRNKPMPIEYDPSLPFGMVWRRDWNLRGNFRIRVEATIRGLPEHTDKDAKHRNQRPGYGLMGVCFGGRCLHESWVGGAKPGNGAWMAAWRDDRRFGVYDHATDAPKAVRKQGGETSTAPLEPGQKITIDLAVTGDDPATAQVVATLTAGAKTYRVSIDDVNREKFTDGYFGLVSRGQLDFEVNRVLLDAGANRPLHVPVNELLVCYALGDSLRVVTAPRPAWTCRFIGLFRNDGNLAEVRIADTPNPAGGWGAVPAAGKGEIITNDFRRSTAVIDAVLPASPADKTLYYTVWKDGRNVTADPRLGTDSVGPGTGWVGTVPTDGNYVGRLPRLSAPYRLCGLSCHAIHASNAALPDVAKFQAWWFHDQPTPEAYRHLDAYDFQIMLWEDDVWYLELIFPPPSTDDAYKIITSTLAGPTTRWQMMRHWNVINPGDHDHGMDDVKGPEQIILRNRSGLGQDADYLGRNFQIVSHLIRGEQNPSVTENPKRWRRWKMPAGDFSLLIMDSRLWRSSQDTRIWDDQGWGHERGLYGRTDPTRSLLGEEQFAWLAQTIHTDTSPLICLTGINGLHTIWTGVQVDEKTKVKFAERDRVAADYAGWVAAGVDRVLQVLGSRAGVVSVYGDVHNGCIMKNVKQRVYECSFGPIGRYGGRAVIPGFGPKMKDFDGRDVEILALYHQNYQSPTLEPITGPKYWNFLEMRFDPRGDDPKIALRIRNLVDAPGDAPRGGGFVETTASRTGRIAGSRLPAVQTLPGADARLSTTDGTPLRGIRCLPDGRLPMPGLPDVPPGTPLVLTAHVDGKAEARIVTTVAVE